MIQAILFDLDGTLLDRRQSLEQFIHDQYNRFASHLMSIKKQGIVLGFLNSIIMAIRGKIKYMLLSFANTTLPL